ncbi:hypothetical protein L7F22_023993 [Adiantum nelumboides]|nr:hypothetical protein [Adiantum nelumboides]
MATRSEQLNWQEIHLSEDKASAQGTHAVRFLVQQVEKAQNNSLLRPMLNNLMRAHGLQLLNYEPPTQDPSFQEPSNEGNAREERGAHSQDDASSGRSRSPSRRIRRPLEREDNSLRSIHNFISIELAQKLGIQTEEMGTALEASGAFKGQYVPVTPLIGKLRVHVQGYVDQEEFCISPLATEDVILGAPWFRRLTAVLEYPTRTISFKFRNRDINIHTEDRGNEIPKELPPSHGEDDHKIELIPGSSPPNRPPYRVSYAQQEEILTQVNELLEKGLPVPRIEDIFDRLQGSTYYSRIDLKSGYHQIRIVPEDINKAAFRTQFGLYEYVVMPFGLTNAPSTFNRLMENIFCKHSAYTGVFFDDIIVHSQTLEEHKKHLQSIFDELQANRLFVKGKKSEFFMKEIKYLGHIISKEGIRMDPEKLRVIDEWPEPCNVHELRSFLGKKNQVADALSRRPRANAVSIAYNHDLTSMIGKYAEDSDYQGIMQGLAQGQVIEPYSLKEEFLLYENRLCVTKDMRGKVMSESHEPPYAGHRGIQPRTRFSNIPCQKRLVILGSRSETTEDGIPWYLNIWDVNIVAMFFALIVFLTGRKCACLLKRSTMVHIPLFPCMDLGNPKIKSMDILCQGASGIGKGCSNPEGLPLSYLTKLNFSFAYHHQTDGQSEIANSIVLDLLKSYVGEVTQANQWEKYLPHVEYAYNNTIRTSTGKTPFEVIEGRPRLPLILKPHEKIFAVDEEVRDIRVAFDKIKESIQSAQQTYKRAADRYRKPLQFKEGDWVLLRFTKARLNMTTGKNWKGEQTGHQKYYMKLAKRYYGPFQILSRINETAYRLKLPANWHIHNAFYVNLLKPFKGDPPKDPVQEEPPLFDDIEEVLQPEEILRHEENTLRSGKVIRRYIVKFKHYSNEDSKWMQGTQMKDVLPLLQAYKTLHGLM